MDSQLLNFKPIRHTQEQMYFGKPTRNICNLALGPVVQEDLIEQFGTKPSALERRNDKHLAYSGSYVIRVAVELIGGHKADKCVLFFTVVLKFLKPIIQVSMSIVLEMRRLLNLQEEEFPFWVIIFDKTCSLNVPKHECLHTLTEGGDFWIIHHISKVDVKSSLAFLCIIQ
jgi:hypothetical protein